jgi:hypothetical protein
MKSSLLPGVLIGALLSSCVLPEPPTDEELARRRAAMESILAQQSVEGRASLEAALAEALEEGETVLTIRYHNGVQVIARDFELLPNGYCAAEFAVNGTQSYDDYWRPVEPPERHCQQYNAVARARPGDARD